MIKINLVSEGRRPVVSRKAKEKLGVAGLALERFHSVSGNEADPPPPVHLDEVTRGCRYPRPVIDANRGRIPMACSDDATREGGEALEELHGIFVLEWGAPRTGDEQRRIDVAGVRNSIRIAPRIGVTDASPRKTAKVEISPHTLVVRAENDARLVGVRPTLNE